MFRAIWMPVATEVIADLTLNALPEAVRAPAVASRLLLDRNGGGLPCRHYR